MIYLKRFVTVLVIGCYLLVSNGFAHLGSMNIYGAQQQVTVPMHLTQNCDSKVLTVQEMQQPDAACITTCLEQYNEVTAVATPFFSDVQQTRTFVSFFQTTNSLSEYHTYCGQAPPDGRRIAYGKQTPYFSHKDLVKLE